MEEKINIHIASRHQYTMHTIFYKTIYYLIILSLRDNDRFADFTVKKL